MATQTGEILVLSENPTLLRELAGKARRIADDMGWGVAALALRSEPGEADEALASAGIDAVYEIVDPRLSEFHADLYSDALAGAIGAIQPRVVLVGATKQGLEIAPRVAERVQAGYAAWALDFSVEPSSGQTTAKCMIYSGIGTAVYRFKKPIAILSVAPGSFEPVEGGQRALQVIPLQVAWRAPRLEMLGYREKSGGSSRWEEAQAIVDVGQGVKQKEDLALVDELAQLLGGQMACSRPVAADRDWFPEWLGLSGKKVKPKLCVTIGVSGAIQHVVGIRDSRVVVAINVDENAGIFLQADYGVVADLYEFLPRLVERMKARHIHLA